MSDYAEVEQTVKGILAEQLGMDASQIRSDARLVEDLGMDSFGSVETAFELEEKFDIKIPDEAIYEAKVVKDIVDYIASQTQAKPSV